jgi:hypothetical protein
MWRIAPLQRRTHASGVPRCVVARSEPQRLHVRAHVLLESCAHAGLRQCPLCDRRPPGGQLGFQPEVRPSGMRSHEEPTAAQRGGRWLRGSSLVALNPNAATDSLHSLRAAGLFTRSHHTPVHISRTARESAADAAASNAANRAILDDRRDNPPPRMTQAVRITLSPSLCSPQPAVSWRRSNPEVSPRALAGAGGAALLALCAATTAVVRAIQPVAHQWARQAASRSCSPGEVAYRQP